MSHFIWPLVVSALGGWLAIFCLSVYAHRSIAHRAVTLHPIVAHFMRFWLWFATGTPTRRWVAVHRKHHAFTDLPEDPHSPAQHGLAKIFFLGYFYYRREAMNKATIEKYGGDNCPNDWLERNVYDKHDNLGLLLMLGLDLLLFGWYGLFAYAVQIIWVSLWAAGFINGVGHVLGYRNFDTKDTSRNIMPVAVICSGEELHNNHHRWPRSAKFAMKWWEVDVGWMFIRTLSVFGMANSIYVRNKRWTPRAVELPSVDLAPEPEPEPE